MVASQVGNPGLNSIYRKPFTRIRHRRERLSTPRIARTQGKWLFDLIQNRKLTIAFQPICAAHDPHEVLAQECLLRGWHGETLIYPDALFKTARVLGATATLDLAARDLAFEQSSLHISDGKIFINFAPNIARDPLTVLRHSSRLADELRLSPERIVFEITECETLHDFEACLRIFRAYREAGFGLALDDVGDGYSSLKLLAALRPDFVKLDQYLLRDVHLDAGKSIVARKLIETAHELEIPAIAEGIESEAEYSWARENSADFVQGYLFSVPALPPFVDTVSCINRPLSC